MSPEGVNNLIKKAFDFQAVKEAAEAVMGEDGRIQTKGQAAAEQVLHNHDSTQHWVDITLGMTQRQKEEHERQQAAQAKAAGVNCAYNFDEEHSTNPTAGRPDDVTAFTQSRNISTGDTAYDVAEADEEEDLEDILKEPYDDEEEDGNRMEIQMNQVHKDMGQHCANSLTSSSGEEGTSSRESTKKATSKESLSSENGSSRGHGPAQRALTSDLARSTLQADEAMPVQDQAPTNSRSEELAPAGL
jgi:hypothetical protein